MKRKEEVGEELSNLFDSFVKKSIFKNKIALQANYTPETIPHREKQITQVASIIAPSLRLERPSNLFIYGLTGTGKTLVVQYVRNQLLKKASEIGVSLLIPYINCKLKKVADTEYRILAELINKTGGKVPATGLPTDQLYRKFIDLIDIKKQIVIIIFDEIDQAVKRIGDEFLYNFTRLNTELSKAQITIIGLSNDLKFLDTLDPRVKSSLSEEEILFPPYNALQLQDILRERAKEAFKEGVVSEGVIEKCAALAAREHGDARRALDLLRIAGELVERDNKDKITLDYVDKAKEKIETDKLLLAVETQPRQFQLTLLAIIEALKKVKRERKEDKVFTGDVYNLYYELCKKTKTEVLTQRRISDIIAEFDMLGLINAKVISKGRYGRTREIRLDLPTQLIEKINILLLNSLNQ
ncbi:MAG: ORC1-type DNA replication protein [Candidatus Pacearchaeota archaeon]|nr:ORC1-type DNA replication protein [Candidatus Pacearchaeota archaeon]